MKVRIGRDELLTGLQRVQGVVEKRNTMPILSNILLEAKQEGVEIVATDLEIGMRGLYKGTVLRSRRCHASQPESYSRSSKNYLLVKSN